MIFLELGHTVIHHDQISYSIGADFGKAKSPWRDALSFHQEASAFFAGSNYGGQWKIVTDLPHLSLGIGAAYLAHRDDINNSRLNFALSADLPLTNRVSLAFAHYSNADFTNQRGNHGLNLLSLRYTFP